MVLCMSPEMMFLQYFVVTTITDIFQKNLIRSNTMEQRITAVVAEHLPQHELES